MSTRISIAILSRKFPRNFRFQANFNSKIESWRIFSCSSFQFREFRISSSCYDSFPMKCEFSIKNFCSKSFDTSISTCWNCGTIAESELFLTCPSCKSIQPLDLSIDYFQIFEREKGYEIEDHNLERKYKNLQKKLHPDLVHTKSEKEREYAAEQSARVIDAYHTLRKPLSRAIYLLQLEGVHVDEGKTLSEPELLAEIMEIREAVEEAANSQALKQIQSQIIEKLKIWSKSFGNAFKNRKFEDAITSIQRMTYYERINEEIVKKL